MKQPNKGKKTRSQAIIDRTESELVKSFQETMANRRKTASSLGAGEEKKPGGRDLFRDRERGRRALMWIVIGLIIVLVLIIWAIGLKSNFSSSKGGDQKDETVRVWSDVKKELDQFRENFSNLFSQLNQAQVNQTNQNSNLNQEELKKLTNQVLEKLKQGETSTNSNTNNINSNTNTNSFSANSAANTAPK